MQRRDGRGGFDWIHGTLSRIGSTATAHLINQLLMNCVCVWLIIARCSSLLLPINPSINSSVPLLFSSLRMLSFFSSCFRVGRHIRGWPGAREGTSPMGMLPAASLPSGRGRPRPDFLQPLHHSGPRRIIHPFRYPLSPDCSAQDQLCSCVFRDRVRPSDGHIF